MGGDVLEGLQNGSLTSHTFVSGTHPAPSVSQAHWHTRRLSTVLASRHASPQLSNLLSVASENFPSEAWGPLGVGRGQRALQSSPGPGAAGSG